LIRLPSFDGAMESSDGLVSWPALRAPDAQVSIARSVPRGEVARPSLVPGCEDSPRAGVCQPWREVCAPAARRGGLGRRQGATQYRDAGKGRPLSASCARWLPAMSVKVATDISRDAV